MKVTEQLEAMFSAGGQRVVGAFVYWSLAGVHIPRAEWRERMTAIGLEGAVGRDPRPEAVLSDAVAASVAGCKGVLVRRMGRYVWAVVDELIEGREVVRLEHVLTVRVDPQVDATAVQVVDELGGGQPSQAARALAEKIVAAYADIRAHVTTADLSTMLVTAMHGTTSKPLLGAISLRERTGGLYLLPAGSVAQAKQLAAAVNALGGSRLDVLTLYADAENLAAAAEAARNGFTSQLNALRAELAEFAGALKDEDKGASDRNIDVRVGRLNALDARVGMWADVLGGLRDELVDSIEAARREVAEVLGV